MKEKIHLINDPKYFNHYRIWLEKIINAKTYKLWQKYCRIRHGIYKMDMKYIYKEIIDILPVEKRQEVKGLIKIILNLFLTNIPKKNLKEVNYFDKNRKSDSFDILNFSVIAWDYRIQRPQHLIKNLDKKNRSFYIKNEFIISPTIKKLKPFKITKKEKNIYEVTLSSSKNLFIYSSKPSKKDKEVILASIKKLIKEAKIINPIAKIDHPFWANIINELNIPIIYDCMDNHQGFTETGLTIKKLEEKLFEQADLTITTSRYLNKLAKQNKAKTILIPNAGEYQMFKKADNNKLPIPNDIKKIKSPIIGYYGAIAEWFDFKILESLAKSESKNSIVLIGRVTNNKVNQLAEKYKNIHLLGEKPYKELPNYLQQFDICIIPFILNDLIKATHPVKIFEYFAAGKPVVATKMPEILNLKKLIHFANQNDFNKKCINAINNKNNKKEKQEYAKKNTWKNRSIQLEKEIKKILFPKISIVLLSYNSPKVLNKSIKSILNRSIYPNFELIIVDNNSNKETVDVLNKYKNNPKIKLIFNKKNYGFAKGNNIGLKKSKGEYIILLNNDIIITPGWISRLIFHIKKDKVGLVGPVTNSIGNEAKINIRYKSENEADIENKAREYTSLHWGETLEVNNIAAFCWIMSQKTYKQIGDLDERFGIGMFEDDDYCTRVKKNNQKILISDDVFIHHYGGLSFKKIKNKKYLELFRKNKIKYEKKWGKPWKEHQYRK